MGARDGAVVRAIATHQFVFFCSKSYKNGPRARKGPEEDTQKGPPKNQNGPRPFTKILNTGRWNNGLWPKRAILRSTMRVSRCRIALWDCFSYAIAALIGCYKVAKETGSKFVSQKKSRGATRHNSDPVPNPTKKMTNTLSLVHSPASTAVKRRLLVLFGWDFIQQ